MKRTYRQQSCACQRKHRIKADRATCKRIEDGIEKKRLMVLWKAGELKQPKVKKDR